MSEIYIEGRFKMPVVNTDEFGYDEEEAKKFDWEDFAKDEFWNSCVDMGELEDKYDITFHKVQPQLTIPKSVADLLDKFIEFVFEDIGHEEWWIQENGLIEWFSKTPNCYIKDAYLAGKALGVDLVKVVEE